MSQCFLSQAFLVIECVRGRIATAGVVRETWVKSDPPHPEYRNSMRLYRVGQGRNRHIRAQLQSTIASGHCPVCPRNASTEYT
jgi:hypothetical protein